jgi:hypothetical protein
MFLRISVAALALSVSSFAAEPGPAQADNPNWFPFPISVLESAAAPVDLSFLNEKPAGSSGFLRAEGALIVNEQGKPVRLFGTNFCGQACFPEAQAAEQVARHLAKSGVNVVRLHHMDNGWGRSIIRNNETSELDAEYLAKLDKLIAELMANGIYVNINLHVSRTYPGTPKGAPDFSKSLDHFHPPFIAAFKAFSKALLTHVNPHTGRAYKDEPGVALIEMNNENTLVLNPWMLGTLPEPFLSEINELFRKHLAKLYPSTEKLRESWGVNDGKTGPNLLKNGSFSEGLKHWAPEANDGAKAEVKALPEGAVRWTSTASGKNDWSIQLSQKGLVVDQAKAYRVKFKARSEKAAKLSIHAQNAAPPWAQLGLRDEAVLTPEWQSYEFEFSPHSVLADGQNRIVFGLNNAITTVDISAVELCEISTGYLTPEQTLEAGNISVPQRKAGLAVRKDFFDFIAQLEIDHASEMKRFLKEDLGVKQMISHSQVLFGGIVGARREFQVSDIVDTHGYWHHPHFPRKSWDMGDWVIENVSQLQSPDGGTLAEMAMQRPFGRPYSVSEYDTPAPNDFAADTFPLLAAMASLQDWSAVYHFNFKNGYPYDSDRITSFFDLPGHSGKQAFVPLSALIYRKGLIPSYGNKVALAGGKTGVVEYAADKAGGVWGSWRDLWSAHGKTSGLAAWQQQVGYELKDDSLDAWGTVMGAVKKDTARAVAFDQKAGTFACIQDKALILAGGASCTEGPLQVQLDAGEKGLVVAAALDDKPLADSKKIWLCALTRAENQGMGWDEHRRTVGRNWGRGPTLLLGLNAQLKLATKSKVQTMSSTGAVVKTLAESTDSIRISPADRTAWWLITRE